MKRRLLLSVLCDLLVMVNRGVDPFVYGRATLMSKRLGYDY